MYTLEMTLQISCKTHIYSIALFVLGHRDTAVPAGRRRGHTGFKGALRMQTVNFLSPVDFRRPMSDIETIDSVVLTVTCNCNQNNCYLLSLI